jgi:signal-transduction protein with cAMP-binding, CBS, and nucleotidyltransferase domain
MELLTNTICNALNPYYQISVETSQALSQFTEIKEYIEGEIIEKENNTVLSEYVVLEGIVRAFIINSKGDDVTVNFYTKGRAVTPGLMRSKNNTALYNIQIISKTASLLVFSKSGMEKGMQNFDDLGQFGQFVIMQDAIQRIERELFLLKSTGKGKLNWFRKRFPNLENEIQHYHIASFLGLTSTSLSRIRATDLK